MEWRGFLAACGLRVEPGWVTREVPYDNPGTFAVRDPNRFNAWKNCLTEDFSKDKPVKVIYYALDGVTSGLLRNSSFDLKKMAKWLYNSWQSRFKDELKSNNDLLLPGYFTVEFHKRNAPRWIKVKDRLWGDIDPKLIPIETVDGTGVPAGFASKVGVGQVSKLEVARKYLTLVSQSDDGSSPYHHHYLESLDVPKLTIKMVNDLWNKDPKYYGDVIKVAVELLRINIPSQGLMIYDRETGRTRPYDDFRLGSSALQGIPLIEAQYGEQGRILGEELKLKSESKLSVYLQILESVFDQFPQSLETKRDQLLSLLRDWTSLDDQSKRELIQTEYTLRNSKGLSTPIVVTYKRDDQAHSLKLAGYHVLALRTEANETLRIKRAAGELGFISIEETGSLRTTGEHNLSEDEAHLFMQYLDKYQEIMDEREKVLLEERLSFLGTRFSIVDKIKKVESASRELQVGKKLQSINLKLPFLQKQPAKLLVSHDENISNILAHLLSMVEFAPYKSVLRDLGDLRAFVEPRLPISEKRVRGCS